MQSAPITDKSTDQQLVKANINENIKTSFAKELMMPM